MTYLFQINYLHMRIAKYCVAQARDVIGVKLGTKIVLLSQSHLHSLLGTLGSNGDQNSSYLHLFLST